MIGDSDDHHFLRLAVDDYDYAGPTLHLGSLLFSSKDYAVPIPGAEWETMWLLGYELYEKLHESLKSSQHPPNCSAPHIKAYNDEGFVRISSADLLLFCDFSLFGGERHFMGHNHCDTSSFLLWKGDRPIVIDPGTYTFRRSLKFNGAIWRDFLRSSSAHNTTIVDSHSQAIPIGDFGYNSWPSAKLLVAESMEDLFLVAGEHKAYQDIVGHAVRIFVVTGSSVMVIDWFPESVGTHTYETNVLFKQTHYEMKGHKILLEDGTFYWMTGPRAEYEILRGNYDPLGGWYSPSYGTLMETPQFRGRRTIEGPAVISFLIDLSNKHGLESRSDSLVIDSLPNSCFAIRARSSDSNIVVLVNPARERFESPVSYDSLMTDAFIAVYEEKDRKKRTLMYGGTYFKSTR